MAACRSARPDRRRAPLRRNSRQSDRRRNAADRSPARQAGVLRRTQLRSAIRSLVAHRAVCRRALSWGSRGLSELSLNEVESLALKVGRGAGFPWGLAEDIGRVARASP